MWCAAQVQAYCVYCNKAAPCCCMMRPTQRPVMVGMPAHFTNTCMCGWGGPDSSGNTSGPPMAHSACVSLFWHV